MSLNLNSERFQRDNFCSMSPVMDIGTKYPQASLQGTSAILGGAIH